MRKYSFFSILALFVATLFFSTNAAAQAKPGDGTPAQRLEVMRQKLDTMRRSLNSAASVLRDENKGDDTKKDDKDKLETPLGRLLGLEKDVSRLSSEVNSLRGKVDRSEKFEMSEIDQVEQAVAEMLTRVDAVQLETANARAANDSPEGKAREVKKKKKFLGIFGGGGNDEYDELIGSVSPGRDRELFIVATREVRKKRFDVGRLLFQTIITTYPDSPYLPMAKLAVADSFFLEGGTSSLIQAIAAYQDWLTFFPTHALADRVVLKIGEAEMRQIGLPDRDASRAKRAEVRLKALLQQYPNTILKKDAEERLAQVQNNLGLHNLYIANYYYGQAVNQGKSGLKGAQSRYLEILEKYPNFGYMDEALFKLAVTYMTEEETDEAARYFQRIVRDYPNSEYVAKAKEQLELIGASIPEPNPERASVVRPDDGGFFANFKNQFFGVYPMTIDKNGVLMTKDFDKCRFELIDQIIANQGDIYVNQIPNALSTVVPVDKVVSTAKLPCETVQASTPAPTQQTQPKE
ncbi:MAG TPA: outer membrane protein assembly factor BamD [Pyrinomonadaceae bacterium]|nr:outer membrane protein assembly factor BamD [Pyrinomonadaceae bacterium]